MLFLFYFKNHLLPNNLVSVLIKGPAITYRILHRLGKPRKLPISKHRYLRICRNLKQPLLTAITGIIQDHLFVPKIQINDAVNIEAI